MNDSQRAEFAANGYIIVPNVLSADQLAELNAAYDANHSALNPGEGHGAQVKPRQPCTDRHGNTYDGMRFWSKAYRDLIDNPTMLPIITEILGDPKWGHAHPNLPLELHSRIRLDHHNIHYRAPLSFEQGAEQYPNGAPQLHGGAENWHITCVYELLDVGAGDGGFGACPGSQTPVGFEQVRSMPGIGPDARHQWVDSKWTAKHPDWSEDVPVHRVEGKAGDCILFTEKMTHGTVPWEGAGERRTLFYKYVPYGMHHSDAGYDIHDPELTESQRDILEYSEHWFNAPSQGADTPKYSRNKGMTRLHALANEPEQRVDLVPGWCGPRGTGPSRSLLGADGESFGAVPKL